MAFNNGDCRRMLKLLAAFFLTATVASYYLDIVEPSNWLVVTYIVLAWCGLDQKLSELNERLK